jgi:antirestriction protein ArdC
MGMDDYKAERAKITDEVIALLESGHIPWERGWDASSNLPYNAASGYAYQGGNVIGLLARSMARGWKDPRFVTKAQASKLRYSSSKALTPDELERNKVYSQGHPLHTPTWTLREGQKPTYVEFWKFSGARVRDYRAQDDDSTASDGGRRRGLGTGRPLYCAVYFVFNASQLDGPPALPERRRSWQPHDVAEQLLRHSRAQIEYGLDGDVFRPGQAYYSPTLDTIHLPDRDRFVSTGAFYATALHELGHWTGHSSRLNRDLTGAFGTELYAREELRAEMSSMYLCSDLGLPSYPTQAAAYLQSWITILRKEPNALYQAARDAHLMADYVVELSPEFKIQLEQQRKLDQAVSGGVKYERKPRERGLEVGGMVLA